MYFLSRKLVAAVSASLFGLIAVWGHALHGLPGLSHSCDCGCVYHSRQCSETEVDRNGVGMNRDRSGRSADDCPICSFLTLAKQVPGTSASIGSGESVDSLAPPDYAFLADTTVSPYAARGPPADNRPSV